MVSYPSFTQITKTESTTSVVSAQAYLSSAFREEGTREVSLVFFPTQFLARQPPSVSAILVAKIIWIRTVNLPSVKIPRKKRLLNMKICDAHVHLGKSGPWQPYGEPTIYIEQLMPLLDKFNIARALVFPNPNVGDKYPETNDYIVECVKKHPKRLVGFGRVDPRRGEEANQELKRIKGNLELAGVKLHPMVECFRPDHQYFNSFFKKLDQLKLPILIHTGDGFSAPSLASKVARKYPNLVMIFGHLKEGCISALKELPNTYVETSGTLPEFIEVATDIDENRVLFGSDIPYYRFPTQAAIVDAANISNKARRKVYFENFERLFGHK